jgi:chorismate dehydratase
LPRVAASHYLNSAPLIWSFIHGPRDHSLVLIDAVPARCSEMLASGEVAAALVPVIEYQRLRDVSVVPNVCVGSKASVRSVVLVTRKSDLKDIRSVALDESSRTSAALLKIIFREFLGLDPRWESSRPNVELMLRENDAALIIGDPAMNFRRYDFNVFDMASLWREYTGLGFVFAVWAVCEDSAQLCRHIDFEAARDEGLERIQEIVLHYEKTIPLSTEELKRYLTDDITYRIDENMETGLKLYFDLAFKHGLIEMPKALQFFPRVS